MLNYSVSDGNSTFYTSPHKKHTAEKPPVCMTYLLEPLTRPVTEKVYVIDDGTNCIMILSSEY